MNCFYDCNLFEKGENNWEHYAEIRHDTPSDFSTGYSWIKEVKVNFKVAFLVAIFSMLLPIAMFAQNPAEAEWNGNGYSLKKIVSNTSIQTGVNFSYTIIFSAPAGATNIYIEDIVPQTLEVVNVPTPISVNGVTPSVSISGQTVTYQLNGLPAGSASSGSFTIVVKFPEGVTCNGTGARNRAGIRINDQMQYTPYVSTIAIAADPWKITKSVISGVIANPQGGSCAHVINPGDTVTYRLAVTKENPYYGNVVGQHNMSSAVVTDQLPAGAVFLGSSCGVSPPLSGNTFTWQPNGGNLYASTPHAYYYCDITVYYPAGSFPMGTTINNDATLNGEICNRQVELSSNITCILVQNIVPATGGNFRKYVYLTNRVPGCNGYYRVSFQNNGNTPLSPFNINDVIPAGVTVNSFKIYGGTATTTMSATANGGANVFNSNITSYYDSGNIPFAVNDLQVSMTGTMPVAHWIHIYIYFTVNSNPSGTVVQNCATFNGLSNNLTLPPACAPFTVANAEPVPCVLKEVCSPEESYDPGDLIRIRLRVQNIGSDILSGSTIQDQLHSNFTYVGNESYYSAGTYNVTCVGQGSLPSGVSAWSGVVPNHNGSNLSWSIPDIDPDCQIDYVASCGYYGTSGLPFYFIEFDVRVDTFAIPGVTPNNFTISGGNIPTPVTSNTTNTLVAAKFGQQVEKQISNNGGASWSGTVSVNPGNTARYRLNYRNMSNVSVTSINLVDLLPMNDGSADWLVLDRSVSRNSQFSVNYVNTSTHATSLVPSGTAPTPVIDFAAGQNICLPAFGLNTGCNSTSWGSGQDQNVKMNYGAFSLPSGATLREDFDVTVPSGIASQQLACNDFAARAEATFLINGTPQNLTLTPIAAPPVCIMTKGEGPGGSDCCKSTIIDQVFDADLGGCCMKLTTKCEVDSIVMHLDNATFSFAEWNCGQMPGDYQGQSSHTFVANHCVVDMKLCVTPEVSGVVTLGYVIYFSNGEVCENRVQSECKAPDPDPDPDPSSDCCPTFDFKTQYNFPFKNQQIGTFIFDNSNSTSPICSIEIGASPSGNLSPVQLIVDGVPSGQSWNISNIPSSGQLSPSANNSLSFSILAVNYNGVIKVCIKRCDGTQCCYEQKWNTKPVIDVVIDWVQPVLQGRKVAVTVQPKIKSKLTAPVKYVSFGYMSEEELPEGAGFFAAALGEGSCDDKAATVSSGASWIGPRNAFFELTCPYMPSDEAKSPSFNLVFSGGLPPVGCTMFDTEGNIVFEDKLDISAPDSVIVLIDNPSASGGSMLELLDVYPNPASETFRVTFATGERNNVEILLINQLGQILRTLKPSTGLPGIFSTDIDTGGLSNGAYQVILRSGGEVKSRKIIIK